MQGTPVLTYSVEQLPSFDAAFLQRGARRAVESCRAHGAAAGRHGIRGVGATLLPNCERARGHLTAADAARLACKADVGELLLTHISGRYRPQEILMEASRHFPNVRVVADLDRISIRARNHHVSS
ncbi:MAG: hypothetical protein JOY83_16045 [Alphaproteobacteria bacterium]|nr:hypothetical protein [Alphaproteobacteria bacterium]